MIAKNKCDPFDVLQFMFTLWVRQNTFILAGKWVVQLKLVLQFIILYSRGTNVQSTVHQAITFWTLYRSYSRALALILNGTCIM
jgi:hypothetical protein